MNLPDRRPIGGYFELELPSLADEYHTSALRYPSARAAFLALILAGKPARVWMPSYICDSMIAPLRQSQTHIEYYSVDSDFNISDEIDLEPSDWLLYVNYFGVCGPNVDKLVKRFSSQLLVDNSQAFFALPKGELATLYSPRKFFGVPDGGYLVTKLPLDQTTACDESSYMRSSHLLKRLGGHVEAGYQDFQLAEESLTEISSQKMSRLTQRLLSSIDYRRIKEKRLSNFNYLHDRLCSVNTLKLELQTDAVPLCYPLVHPSNQQLRAELLRNRVYCPTYWPGVSFGVNPQTRSNPANSLDVLPLPIDQRYDDSEMSIIVDIVLKTIH